MRRYSLTGAGAIALLVVSGCAEPAAELDPATDWLFLADPDGFHPVAAPALIQRTTDDGHAVYNVDLIAAIQPDQMWIVLVEALGAADVRLDSTKSLTFPSQTSASEGEGAGDFCVFELWEAYVPTELYLARATGAAIDIADPDYGERKFYWSKMSGQSVPLVTIGAGGGGAFSAPLEPGQAMLFAAAQSGLPPTEFNDGENTWTLEIEVEGDARLILLHPPTFLCGNGFGRFGGTSTPLTQLGGALAADGLYGTTAEFSAGDIPADVLSNAATLEFLEEDIPLTSLSHEWRNTYQTGRTAISVERWLGPATWLLAGFSIPVPGPGCPDNCPPAGSSYVPA